MSLGESDKNLELLFQFLRRLFRVSTRKYREMMHFFRMQFIFRDSFRGFLLFGNVPANHFGIENRRLKVHIFVTNITAISVECLIISQTVSSFVSTQLNKNKIHCNIENQIQNKLDTMKQSQKN